MGNQGSSGHRKKGHHSQASIDVKPKILKHVAPCVAIAISSDGDRIVTAFGLFCRIWDGAGELVEELAGHRGAVMCVAFAPNGKTFLTGSFDKRCKLWTRDGNPVTNYVTGGKVFALAFAPDGQRFVTCGKEGMAKVYSVGGSCLRILKETSRVRSLCFSPEGDHVLAGYADGTASLWDITRAEGDGGLRLLGHTKAVTAVAMSPDGLFMVTGGEDCAVRLWERGVALFWY